MPIPLGILAVAGAGAAGGSNSYEHIASVNGTGSSSTIEFISIPSDYKHLQIRATMQLVSSSQPLFMRINGVTSASYRVHVLGTEGSTVYSYADGQNTSAMLFGGYSSDLSSTVPSATVIDILDYAVTTKNKTVRSFTGIKDSGPGMDFASALFLSTDAISSLSLFAGGNFAFSSVSRFSLYGIKG